MARFGRIFAATGLLTSTLLMGLSGLSCANEQEPLIVLYAVLGEKGSTDPLDFECTFMLEPDVFHARGSFDVATGSLYTIFPVLSNNLAVRQQMTNSGVNDSELQLASNVDITLNLPSDVRDAMGTGTDGSALPLSFQSNLATQSLNPGDLMGAHIPVIPPEYAVALQSAVGTDELVDVTVDVVYHATRTGNSRGNTGVLDSRAFTFPITLCNGCTVVACSCDENDECVTGTEVFGGFCSPGSDFVPSMPFDCANPFAGSSGTGTGGDESTSVGLPPDPPPTTTATG